MKKILLSIMVGLLFFTSCEKEPIVDVPKKECSVNGRWIMKMYPNTMKILTQDTMWTLYSMTNRFPGIDSAFGPKHYMFENNILSIWKTRNVYDTFNIEFKCDCNTMNLTNEYGTQVWYKEGFDISTCP